MSTYTDLHNRIKENLTILRKPGSKDDGMSPQKVILVNPENQFYGTFNGNMNITGGILSNLSIVGGEIKGTTIKDAYFMDGDTLIPIGELASSVSDHEARVTKLEKDTETISAAHDKLSSDLSNAIDTLCIDINAKLDDAVENVKKSISGVVGDVATISSDLEELSSKVESLSTSMLNGIVYKGQLDLHRDNYTLPRQLFNDDPACCLLDGTQKPLKNGWMWRVHLDHPNVSGDYVVVDDPNTGRSLILGEGDCIIIKNHDSEVYEVVPDDTMSLDDFDVINAQDEDDTKLEEFKKISAYLDEKSDIISSSLCSEIETDRQTIEDLCSYVEGFVDGNIENLSNTVDGRLEALSRDLSSYSEKLCSELCTEIDSSYVHKTGDSIAKLSVSEDLEVGGRTSLRGAFSLEDDFRDSSGTRLEASQDAVKIQTFAPVMISSSSNIVLDAHDLSINLEDGVDDLFIGDRTIKEVLQDTYLISDDISYRYDKSENALKLGVRGHELSVDVAELFDKKIIKDVRVVKRESGTYIAITFDVDGDPSTSEDEKTIEIRIDDFFKLYTSGYGISIDNELNISIAKSFDDQVQAIQGYVNELSGPVGPYIGIIPSLSAAIDKIDLAQTQELFFGGLIELDTSDTSKHYPTIGAFLSTEIGGADAPSQVRNNSYFDIKFFHGLQTSSVIITEDGLSVGNGDQLIIHEHNPIEGEEVKFISWADLKLIDENAAGNVYLIKAGISRYEFEAESKSRSDADDYISAWIKQNFANTEEENDSLTTVVRQELSTNHDLSVASNAYVLSDLSVAGSLFVNGAQLGITVEPSEDPEEDPTTIAKTVADEITLSSTSSDTQITITNNHITFSKAIVNVDATSSFTVSADEVKVIDATSSQVEILSVLNVNSDQATITILSSGILSADQLIAREVEISENLSVENAFVKNKLRVDAEFDALSGAFWCHKTDDEVWVNTNADYISLIASSEDTSTANQRSKIGLDPEYIDISSDTIYLLANTEIQTDFAKVKDFNSRSSIADLCSALSISISSLSDFVISNDNFLSTAIDRKIFIDGISAESLCAIHISQDDFYQKVALSLDTIKDNELYIVSGNYINAYGQQMKNLSAPTDLSDATTKEYVDQISSTLSDQIQNLSTDLSTEISALTRNLYDQLQHIAEDEIISSLNQKSCISNVICAVVGIKDTLISLRETLSGMLGL